MRKFWLLTIACICVIPAIFNLLKPGYFVSDDGEWMLIRFTSFYQEISSGQFPVRFLSRLNYGHGYPVATFLYPGFMYITTFFKVIGISFIGSIKLLLIESALSAFIGTFLWLSMRFSKQAAFIGALFYIYHPYFLWDIYKRGSVGEVLILGILPFVLYLLERKQYVGASLVSGLILISHNTLSLFFFPFSILYFFFLQHGKKVPFLKTVKSISIFILLSLGTAAFFWIPALFELSYTTFGQTTISNWGEYFVDRIQLLGIFHVIVLGVFVVVLFIKKTHNDVLLLFIGITALVALFLSTSFSYVLWKILPFGTYVQFPFRFLSLFIPSLAFIAAYVYSLLKKRHARFILVPLIILVIVIGFPFLSPVSFANLPNEYYQTNEATTTIKDEYMPIWAKDIPKKHPESTITRINENTVQINTIYWPGHEALVNTTPSPIDYVSGDGLIQVSSASDSDEIDLLFKETPLRLASDAISFVSIIISLALFKKQYG